MSAYVRFSPEFVNQKPSWYFYSTVVFMPPLTGFLYGTHTFFLEKYKALVSYCQNGEPVPVPEDLKQTFEAVKNDIPTSEFFKKFMNIFMVNGFDTFYAGSSRLIYGGLIGIPKLFTFKSIDEAKKEGKVIRIQQSPVQWDYVEPEIRDKFFNSLVFSEKAIKYAMAYNCLLIDNLHCTFYPAWPALLSIINGLVGEYATRKYKLQNKPFFYRILLAFGISSLSICTWISLVNIQKNFNERDANSRMEEMDEEYIEGAIEYWSKIVDRNLALRHLMKDGESRFSSQGKESFLLGSPGINPIDQLAIYKKLLEEKRKKKEEEEPEQSASAEKK